MISLKKKTNQTAVNKQNIDTVYWRHFQVERAFVTQMSSLSYSPHAVRYHWLRYRPLCVTFRLRDCCGRLMCWVCCATQMSSLSYSPHAVRYHWLRYRPLCVTFRLRDCCGRLMCWVCCATQMSSLSYSPHAVRYHWLRYRPLCATLMSMMWWTDGGIQM